MKRVYLFLFCSVSIIMGYLFSCSLSFADEKKVKILSMEEFIETATEKDTTFEEILIDGLTLKYKKAIGLPAGDFVLSVKNENVFLYDPTESDSQNTVSLTRLFPYIGTEISAEYSSSLSKSSHAVTSDFSATISQPVAENAFGRNTRLLNKIIGLEIDVAKFQIIEAYEDYLASLMQLYYDWYSAYENLKTAQGSYDENLKLLENIRQREKSKIALPIDVNKIDLQVLAKKENLIGLKTLYADYLNLIRNSIDYDEGDKLEPVEPDIYKDFSIEFDRDYDKFKESSRTASILKSLEDKSSFEVDKYADELLPSIDIFATYSLEGSNHDLHKNDRIVYAGVTLDWPIPGEVEHAQYETAKIESDKTRISSANIHDTLKINLKNLRNQIERERELIAIADEKITLAKAIVDDDTENYSLGRVTLNDLIDEINKLEDNKFSKIQHTVELRKLIVEWLRLSDRLISKKDSDKIERESF